MKSKKLVCLILVLVLVVACSAAVLTACKGGNDKVIIIWGPAEHEEIYLKWAKKFQEEHKDMLDGYTFSYAGSGDAGAYAAMNVDPTTGAAVYTFANDQAANLRNLGALAETKGDNLEWSRKYNLDTAVEATKLGEGYYGYPLQADNGYFMYYNKAAFKGASFANEDGEIQPGYTFRDMYNWLENTTNKSTYKDSNNNDVVIDWSKGVVTWPMGDSWYMSGMFFSVGGDYEVVYNEKGKQVSADCWFSYTLPEGKTSWSTDGDFTVGLAAFQAIKNSFTNPDGSVNKHYAYTDGDKQGSNAYIQNHTNVDNESAKSVPLAAGVSGTWLAADVKKAWGDDYGATVLPVLETDDYGNFQMKNFAGYKNMGVNPLCSYISNAPLEERAGRLALLQEFAQYLCGKEISLERHVRTGAGPANLEALADESVVNDVALNALNAQYDMECKYPAEYPVAALRGQPVGNGKGYRNQDSVPANYWSPIQSFGQLIWSEYGTGTLDKFKTTKKIKEQLADLQTQIAQAAQ